ncbi:hypothetical protein FN976_21935 [Caenimonas sedimenti]|uniref:Uncharacterized protein n=1 Tax=Caenimonas sedimenti TaxID=2596921 RepID=A0A562ZK33_9BURK|nr:hypothetical protein [Caenimonas sedimenti]TWO68668.1 hypothetical protein FN976_21935 [Caenimonas sedimenti]
MKPKKQPPQEKPPRQHQQQQQQPARGKDQAQQALHSGKGADSALRRLKEWERGRASASPKRGGDGQPSAT